MIQIYQDENGTIFVSTKKMATGILRHLGEAENFDDFAEVMDHDEAFLASYAGEIFKALEKKNEDHT